MSPASPFVSAVICTRNRADLLPRAVHSVLANDYAPFELVVIDQSDSDDSERALGPFSKDNRLRYVHTTRVGLSSAYNTAIATAKGELLAFTDDDCRAPTDWLSRVRDEFAADPGADLLYGIVKAPAEDLAPGVIPELKFTSRKRIGRRDGFVVAGMGANFAARRRAFELAGEFDEVLGGGGPLRSSQDFDLQFRLFRADGISVLTPELRVDHYGLRTAEQWPSTLKAYGIGDGGFYMKHIRCGDLLAARILAGRVLREIAKTVSSPLLLRRRHSTAYLIGMIEGSRGSFRYRVDRGRRLYVITP